MFRLSSFYEGIYNLERKLSHSKRQSSFLKESLNLTLLRKKNSNQAKNVFGPLQFFFEIVSEMKILKIRGFLGPTQNVQKTF